MKHSFRVNVVLSLFAMAFGACAQPRNNGGHKTTTDAEPGDTDADSDNTDQDPNVVRITVVMAADIAEAGRTNYAKDNAALITGHTPAVDAVILGGDNARYTVSSLMTLHQFYQTYYDPVDEANWGQFNAIAFPGLGNHEYLAVTVQGHFDYFANRMAQIKTMTSYHGYIDDKFMGYYSFDLNNWHFVSINSNCPFVSGGCETGSAQETWLKSDLEAHATIPIIGVWHAPRYACGGNHEDDLAMQPMWEDLVNAGADFLFTGHNHYYQRWQPLDKTYPEAVVDEAKGLTEIVVGSYGVSTYPVCFFPDSRIAYQIGDDQSIGVFFLTLGSDGSYSWEYRLRSNGSVVDSGAGFSHHHI